MLVFVCYVCLFNDTLETFVYENTPEWVTNENHSQTDAYTSGLRQCLLQRLIKCERCVRRHKYIQRRI